MSVTPEGKEGHKDMLHPSEGLQHLNHSGDGGTFLGREREREAWEGSPAVSNGERARASRMLCFPSCSPYWGGEGTCPPKGCVSGTMGGEDARQRFSGPSPLLLWDCWRRRRVGAGAVCRELAFYSKGHIFSTEWKK